MKIIRLEGVKKRFGSYWALKGIDLEIEEGDFVAIIGPSGAGKTTLLNLIGALDTPTEGRMFIEEKEITKLKELTWIRREKIGFIFQTFNLIQTLTTYENIEFPMLFTSNLSKQERRQRIERLIKDVGLERVKNQRVVDLSGGEQQRVAIARALAKDAIIILADEPTGNLDTKTGNSIMELMKNLNEEYKKTFLVVTHNPMVISYTKRVYKIEDGILKKDEVFDKASKNI